MKKLLEKDTFWLLLILLVSIIAIHPLFRKGFYSFHDEVHFANLYEMTRAISGGQIPPRWAPDMNFNFGHPFFNFYYLFPFYLGALFNLVLRLSLVNAMKLTFVLSVPFSGLAFYWLMRKFFGKVASFSGAVVYMFTPYRAVDIYVRGAVGEMWSFVFMPMVFAAFASLIEKRNYRNFLFSSLSLAGLIITHNLTSIVFFPFVVLFCIVLILQKKDKLVVIANVLACFLAAFSLAAYYWLPAFLEKKFMSSAIRFYPFDHFPFIKQLLFPSWGYGVSVWGPNDGMSFQIGVANLLIVVFTIYILLLKRRQLGSQKVLLFFLLFCFSLCVFLMNIRSWFLWKIIPLGVYLEFPWRLLMLTTFFSSFLAGFLENLFNKKKSKYLIAIFALIAIAFTWKYFKPQNFLIVNDDYYLRRFFADRISSGKSEVVSKEYFNYGEGHLPLTIWTEYRPSQLPSKKIEISQGEVSYEEISPVWYKISTNSKSSSELLFHTFYFPGWEALVDDKKTKILISKPLGEIVVPLSSGGHNVMIKLRETPLRLITDLVSLFTLVILLLEFVSRPFCCKKVRK